MSESKNSGSSKAYLVVLLMLGLGIATIAAYYGFNSGAPETAGALETKATGTLEIRDTVEPGLKAIVDSVTPTENVNDPNGEQAPAQTPQNAAGASGAVTAPANPGPSGPLTAPAAASTPNAGGSTAAPK